jgi:hypothetical protein
MERFKIAIIIILLLNLCSCSYKTTFYKHNEEVARIESGSKGTYTFKDNECEMTADFGKPLFDIGNLSPKYESEN